MMSLNGLTGGGPQPNTAGSAFGALGQADKAGADPSPFLMNIADPRPDTTLNGAPADGQPSSTGDIGAQLRKARDFDAAQGRPLSLDGRAGGRQTDGEVRFAQAQTGTMTDALPGAGGQSDSPRIHLEDAGRSDGAWPHVTNGALRVLGKAAGVVGGVLIPDNSSHDQTLTMPGHPQFRITGKESEVSRTLEVRNADGSFEPIGAVSVSGNSVRMAEVNDVLKDRGFTPIGPIDAHPPGFPADPPDRPTTLATPDRQEPLDGHVHVTPDNGSIGGNRQVTLPPDGPEMQILEARNAKLDGKLRQLGLPTEGDITFDPPKRATENTLERDRGPKHGFVDADKNEWNWDKGKQDHWDVTLSEKGKRKYGHLSKSGTHLNVSQDGRIAHGSTK